MKISILRRARPRVFLAAEVLDRIPVLAWWLRWHPSRLWGIAFSVGAPMLLTKVGDLMPKGEVADPVGAVEYGWQRFAVTMPRHRWNQEARPLMLMPDGSMLDRLRKLARGAGVPPQEVLGAAVVIGMAEFNERMSEAHPAYADFVKAERSEEGSDLLRDAYDRFGYRFPKPEEFEAAEQSGQDNDGRHGRRLSGQRPLGAPLITGASNGKRYVAERSIGG